MKPLDAESIRKSLTVARDAGFRSIKMRSADTSFQAVFSEEALTWGESLELDEPTQDVSKTETVLAPVVGYVRWLPEIVTPNAELKAGQTVGEVLALGIANEITTKSAGKIKTILAESGDPVEFAQALLEIELT